MPDVGHVDAAGRDVRGHKDPEGAPPESFQGRPPLRQAPVTVDDCHSVAGVAERPSQTIGAMLRAGKNEDRIAVLFQHGEQELGLVLPRRVVQGLRGPLGGRRRPADRHPHRVLDAGPREIGQVGRHRRREEQRLPLLRKCFQDLIDLGREPHVQHAVRFVQHQDLHLHQIDGPVPHVVQESARRRHDDVRALAQPSDLGIHVGAAHNRRRIHEPAVSQLGYRFLDLDGQLPGGSQDQPAGKAFRLAGQALDHRNHEGRGLARAGLRAAKHVASREPGRYGLGLDGRGFMEPHLVEVM